MARIDSCRIEYGSLQLAADLFLPEKNEKPAVIILCHGAFETKEKFHSFATCFAAKGFAALVPDMPGHGRSNGCRYCVDIPSWKEAVHAAMNFCANDSRINTAKIGLFGFSSGGTAVLEAAATDQRPRAIVTLDATVRNFMGFIDTLFFKILVGAGKVTKRLTGRQLRLNMTFVLHKAKCAHDPRINNEIISDPQLNQAYASLPFPGASGCAFVDTINRVHLIKAPTFVLHGQEDRIDSPESARMLFEKLTCEKRLFLVPESGHCGHLDTNSHLVLNLAIGWFVRHLSI